MKAVLFFIEEILKCKSLSIVGLEKNTGKTECLNYILRQVKDSGKTIALTSIGTDGEKRDQVCQTAKPEIEVFEGMLFVTSEPGIIGRNGFWQRFWISVSGRRHWGVW